MTTEKFQQAVNAINAVRDADGVNIQGKSYTMVKHRIEIFRNFFGDEYGIDTDVAFHEISGYGLCAIGKAAIKSASGFVLAAGTAMEVVGSTKINAYSPLENAETSAIGRALAAFGLHGGEYASANEMDGFGRKVEQFREPQQQQYSQPREVAVQSNQVIPEVKSDVSYKPYIPAGYQGTDPWGHVGKIADSLSTISGKEKISHYWNVLKYFRTWLVHVDGEAMSELKAAFEVAAKG